MPPVSFRVYADLNDFLEPARRGTMVVHEVAPRTAVKDAIEALGIPHPEVDLLLVDGGPAAFTHLLHGGERVSVFPRFRSLDVARVSLVRPGTPEPVCFLLDVHLGRLAAYLRLVGFDAAYRNDADDRELAAWAVREERALLTRDVGLLKRNEIRHGYFVRATAPAAQLVEVLGRFGLFGRVSPFSRCLRCNVPIAMVGKADVLERLPARVRERHDEFRECPACRRVYWKGTHYAWMVDLLARVAAAGAAGG